MPVTSAVGNSDARYKHGSDPNAAGQSTISCCGEGDAYMRMKSISSMARPMSYHLTADDKPWFVSYPVVTVILVPRLQVEVG